MSHLAITPLDVPPNRQFHINGSGFDPVLGNVNFTMQDETGLYFWSAPCETEGLTYSTFWTEGPGHYVVTAWQNNRRKQKNLTSTSFEVRG